MKLRSTSALICLLLAGFTTSCREDPQDVKQHQRQSAELSQLRSGISVIEAQIQDMPADLSAELKEAGKLNEEQKAGIQELNAEISEVSGKIKSSQDGLKAYRVKYQIQ